MIIYQSDDEPKIDKEALRSVFSDLAAVLPIPEAVRDEVYKKGWEDCAFNVERTMRIMLSELK